MRCTLTLKILLYYKYSGALPLKKENKNINVNTFYRKHISELKILYTMILELKNIFKTYKTDAEIPAQEVLSNVSLQINKQDALAIIGPSGCGKSTLLNIMGTLDTPTSGIVTLNGTDISGLNNTQMAAIRNQNIGFVFQQHHLLPQLNLIENVLVPAALLKDKDLKKEAFKRAQELLHIVGLSESLHKRPGQLSGGECQRAAVVRALINKPDIILADEPTGSLDEESADQIGKLLSEINKKHNTALVLVTHALELAKKMDKIYKLNKGQLATFNE